MDPTTAMAAAKVAKEAAETISGLANTVGDIREKWKDGDARRENDSKKLEASILYGKWATVFEGVGVATTAAQAVSGIIKEQRESKVQADIIYADIEDKHKKVEAEIENIRKEWEKSYRQVEAEIQHQITTDEHNYQIQLKMHEAKLLELERQYAFADKKEDDSHEAEMERIRREDERERERIEIERMQVEKDIRIIDYEIETNRKVIQPLINYMNIMLEELVRIMTWEMTPENQVRIQQQQSAILAFLPQLQALPMIKG